VHVLVAIRVEGVGFQLEELGFDRRQLATEGTREPAREGRDRYANQASRVESAEGEVSDILGLGWPVEALDALEPGLTADRCEQPRLPDQRGVAQVPALEPEHERREAWEVDDAADAEGVNERARAQRSDPGASGLAVDRGHDAPSPDT